jgi:hypothetical protein
MRGESRRARPLTATAGARAGCPWSRRPQRRVLRPPLLVHRWVLAPPAFPSGCAVPQGPPPSTWRARSGRASCESATPRRSRRRGSCSHPGILYLFPKRAKTSVRIRKRDHRRWQISHPLLGFQPAGGPCVSWYRGILYGRTPTYGFTRGRTSLCRSLRGPPRQRGRLPAGPTGGPACRCPAYTYYI